MMKLHRWIICLVLCFSLPTYAQSIDSSRIPTWNQLGNYDTTWIINLQPILFDTVQSNHSFTANETFDYIFLNHPNTKVLLPLGNITLTSPIVLPANILIEGRGADSTQLHFNTNQQSDLISATGSKISDYTYNLPIQKGDTFIINPTSQLNLVQNDFIYICDDDLNSITSSWAEKSTGQFLRVKSLSNDTIYVVNPIRRNYTGVTTVTTLNPIRNIGLTKFKLTATEETINQTSNIQFRFAVNCFVSCLKSENSNFAHVTMENSSNLVVSNSEFKDGFTYGSGGKAYGVVLQFGSGDCVVENNYFEHLRHSVLFQAGVNGNAVGYNYSVDPYWTDVSLPSNSAGDIVFHGNYPYMNLVEGNNCQHIVIDDSHGKNGPFNTLLRNRSDLYGIFMNTNPSTDSLNVIANEVTNTGFLLGLYILSGNGLYTFGNNIKGTCNPASTQAVTLNSLYLNAIPDYYNSNNSWPPFGYPNAIGDHINFARAQKQAGKSLCEECCNSSASTMEFSEGAIEIFPNPASDFVIVYTNNQEISRIRLINMLGQTLYLVNNVESNKYTFPLYTFSSGNYIIEINAGGETTRKNIQKK